MRGLLLLASIPAVVAITATAYLDSGVKPQPSKTPSAQATPYAAPPIHLTRNFHGFPCKTDCSGHEAGYAWAEKNDITEEDDCTGNSESFIEGCIAWVAEERSGQK